jgi:hypothetical protein
MLKVAGRLKVLSPDVAVISPSRVVVSSFSTVIVMLITSSWLASMKGIVSGMNFVFRSLVNDMFVRLFCPLFFIMTVK